jgi:hypothetical protein
MSEWYTVSGDVTYQWPLEVFMLGPIAGRLSISISFAEVSQVFVYK